MSKQRTINIVLVRIHRGFSLVAAIFLLVVLAALGAAMMTFSTVQHTTAADDVLGASGYQAARAGIEWGAFQVLQNSSCVASTTLPALGGSLAGFTVTVTCSSTGYTEGGTTATPTVTLYNIKSTASRGTTGGIIAIERELQTTIAK